jgi:hypothetical protein
MDKQTLLLAGLILTGLLLLVAWPLRFTGGLFWSRTIHGFFKDRADPRYEAERKTGLAFQQFVFHYIPPFFIIFLLGYLFLSFLGIK